ncbi:uncharacterized protein LOC127131676 [Lathyrus oleraceus]|uniref:uncharacterized protein LOC127131676 n=1 Tax=Pisum sativum TaxID=3888 RepID=UPI0021D1E892|nr:uncharacterized protein LOC127131676 [Pisum sativum]
MAYLVDLSPPLANLHDVFHVSQLRRYISDPSHVIQVDDVQVGDNLIVDVSPVWIEDWDMKQMYGKEIALVKVFCGRPTDRSITWEREKQLRESYLNLFSSAGCWRSMYPEDSIIEPNMRIEKVTGKKEYKIIKFGPSW